jgi:hypothetical protein
LQIDSGRSVFLKLRILLVEFRLCKRTCQKSI